MEHQLSLISEPIDKDALLTGPTRKIPSSYFDEIDEVHKVTLSQIKIEKQTLINEAKLEKVRNLQERDQNK